MKVSASISYKVRIVSALLCPCPSTQGPSAGKYQCLLTRYMGTIDPMRLGQKELEIVWFVKQRRHFLLPIALFLRCMVVLKSCVVFDCLLVLASYLKFLSIFTLVKHIVIRLIARIF